MKAISAIVKKIHYEYTNSGGGKSNTHFRMYNGSGAVAFTWKTPDNRENKRYKKNVRRTIRRGDLARIYQKTWFDTFGKDPECSYAGYFQ
ncbi:MAG: hypothetical protein ACRDKY_11375 [Solirubrobacteraceae bacterium]